MSESRRSFEPNAAGCAPPAARGRSPRGAGGADPALMRFPARERAEIAELLELLSAKPAETRSQASA